MRTFVSTTIPYVNADPHVGFALECVLADTLARHRRLRGDGVHFGTGTDDNAAKNVRAAAAAGVDVDAFVAARAEAFAALREPLRLSTDDFIRTSADPRHRPGVERLWQACAADLYEREYEGRYCAGCETFVDAATCPEHGPAELVAERNWFFRLSRYVTPLLELLESGRLRIEPRERRNEVLSFVRGGLEDVSVSRSRARSGSWGIPVPGDPSQVVWVWFDALANYVTALGYGTDDDRFRRRWEGAERRVHVVGKDVTRFHAVIWPALLLAAGLQPPTAVVVHGFLTASGRKLSKSAGGAASPFAAVDGLGVDALRWWLLRDVPPGEDADYRPELVAARGRELADVFGNLVARTAALTQRADVPEPDARDPLAVAAAALPQRIDEALERFDVRAAALALLGLAQAANRHVTATRPWQLPPDELGPALAPVVDICRVLARELEPLLPGAGRRIEAALAGGERRVFAR
jgi:methionyl-tRNA synthetase